MRKYEAMFILRPDLKEEEVNLIAKQITEPITKNNGKVAVSDVWSGKRRLCYPIKKHKDGIYYRVNFTVEPNAIESLKQGYRLNDNILRLLITNQED